MTLDPRAIEGPVLIVAPHPDDESLGCGGLIAACQRGGQRLHTVFVTEGGASHLGSKLWNRARLARCREREALKALGRLGAGDTEHSFLRLADADMPDVGSPAYKVARDRLIDILGELSHRLVILPWRRDPHRDHRDAWFLVMDCLQAAAQTPDTLEYAIWLDELGTGEDHPRQGEMERVSLDISQDTAMKRHAVRAHRSQLGGLIQDDPAAFVLSERTLDRLTQPQEIYWRSCALE